jgi:GT2 family glycosyltransferase
MTRAAASGEATHAGADALPIGVVVIGRNEAAHLPACFAALPAGGRPLVYVDSESGDDSVAIAQRAGATVVRLDRSRPLTAARSRNAGAARLLELAPDVAAIQFVDGDCELVDGFVDAAARELAADARLGGVCGRLLERRPDASPYIKLCALDWRMQRAGDGAYCGIVLVRVAAFRDVRGFAEDLIAGEDPDFAFRLAQAGFVTRRIERDMARHDAALDSFGPWWRRTVRTGHSDAELAWRHRGAPGRDRQREVASTLLWGFALPLGVAAAAAASSPAWLAALALYPLLWLRILLREGAAAGGGADARLYATGCVVSKFAQALGVLRFALGLARVLPRRGLIE